MNDTIDSVIVYLTDETINNIWYSAWTKVLERFRIIL